MTGEPRKIPGVVAPPPLIYGVPLLAGILLDRVHHWPALRSPAGHVVGPILVALGLLAIPAILAFRRAGTSPNPWRPTTALVTGGPYRISRNPMYVGFTFIYAGVTAWVDTMWPLLALPAVLWVMYVGVIRREEAYLEQRFGEEYRRYKASVRRWL